MARARGGSGSPGRDAGLPPVPIPQLKSKVWLEVDGRFVIGDGGLRLLEGILAHGSLLRAAQEMGWSYRHAWGYLKRAEEAFGTALTVARAGKGASRGMALTESGRQLAAQLADFRRRIDDAVGPSGPTPEEVAERGAPRPPARRVRDGDWRRLG